MIDTLKMFLKNSETDDMFKKYGVKKKMYALCTLHRSENVDNKENLAELAEILKLVSDRINVVFPMHPRTKENIRKFGLNKKYQCENLFIVDPVGYIDFLNLEKNAKFVITDSGGIQEETTAMKIPCLTLRNETERPITAEIGTNVVTGLNKHKIIENIDLIMQNKFKKGKVPKYWDGNT
ncbi:MAG: UDP-N-acetylglucosamine 2-epimerase (non-hydrolyzing), partial [Flavobacterium sp.]|nr:UDP-N-acetylglucosamine 2-epimerase (non-hydrolyzing) [Flavobacterium sp.]